MPQLVRISGWLAVLLFIALSVLAAIWIAPKGEFVFDARFWGYRDDAVDLLVALDAPDGARARNYLIWHRALDTVFPVALTVWMIGMIRQGWRGRLATLFSLLPVAYLIFDLWENLRVAAMLRIGPSLDPAMVVEAEMMTFLKFGFVVPSLVLAILAWRSKSAPKGQVK